MNAACRLHPIDADEIMRIGVDLDNTIVSYNGLFHRVAVRRGWIPPSLAAEKQAVRDFLRGEDRNDDWTELQGLVYGEAMSEAVLFPGVVDFFRAAATRGDVTFIISHRTRYPYRGPQYDLHDAARRWLAASNLMDAASNPLGEANVFLEESLTAKLQRIAAVDCDVFIDDLPELLLHEEFPSDVRRLCFDPAGRCSHTNVECFRAWADLTAALFGTERT